MTKPKLSGVDRLIATEDSLISVAGIALRDFFGNLTKFGLTQQEVEIKVFRGEIDPSARIYARWTDESGLHRNINLAFSLVMENEFHCFGFVWKKRELTVKSGFVNGKRVDVHRVPFNTNPDGNVSVCTDDIVRELMTCYRAILKIGEKDVAKGSLTYKLTADPFSHSL